MADVDWYNVNANRHFPLVEAAETDASDAWPKSAIVDMGMMFGGLSEFDAVGDSMWLSRVEYDGSDITLVFLATPSGAMVEFTAVFDADPLVTPAGTIVDITTTANYGEGFVVVGDTAAIVTAMGGGASRTITAVAGGNAEVEPSRVSTQAGAVATSLTLVHMEPTRWVDSCSEDSSSELGLSSSSTPGNPLSSSSLSAFEDYITVISALDGGIFFADGYNVKVVLSESENSITFLAGIGLGEGEPCNWVDQGEPRCGDVIMAINGISAADNGTFTIQGGPGIAVIPYGEHGLFVGIGDVDDLYCESS